jgi:hypothetical protein
LLIELICSRTQVHWVDTTEPIKILKEKMYQWTGIPLRHQRLMFGARCLDDHRTLDDYRVFRDCTISVVRIRDEETSAGGGLRQVMNVIELDHYGYLFGKVVRQFRGEEEPPAEVCDVNTWLT